MLMEKANKINYKRLWPTTSNTCSPSNLATPQTPHLRLHLDRLPQERRSEQTRVRHLPAAQGEPAAEGAYSLATVAPLDRLLQQVGSIRAVQHFPIDGS